MLNPKTSDAVFLNDDLNFNTQDNQILDLNFDTEDYQVIDEEVYSDTEETPKVNFQPPPENYFVVKKKRKHSRVLKFTTRSAGTKEPSVLWISKTGKFYRTVLAARIDNAAQAVIYNEKTGTVTLPETKTVVEAEKAKRKSMFMFIGLGIVALIIIYKIIK